MLKLSSLILLVAVAIFWSHADAEPDRRTWHHPSALAKRYAPYALAKYRITLKALAKRGADNISTESEGKLIKTLLIGLLMLATDNSVEERALSEKYMEAMNSKWDSLDDFAKYVADTFVEVTGTKIDDINYSGESCEKNDES